ncbi:hypothetical protein [Sporomusa malonica]|uniref:Haloacid dehalogenase-like hydrolase n=1 Tax=Sporomusa malonica TaxID=112901 RepID=A0A1W2EDH9_9FIRM|nr:hypothetical protein [Sporomusa malonica]SMD07804.1 hypothetical protein SAMN04488500_12350 [Sporomusa malonica]
MRNLKGRIERMALFDMDDTLLLGRFIDKAAAELGFSDKLEQARDSAKHHIESKAFHSLLTWVC